MVDPKRLDELSETWPVHGMRFQNPIGECWKISVVEISDSQTATADETTVVLRFDLAPDHSGQRQTKSQRHLTLTFPDFKHIRDLPTATRYAESLHIAILEFLSEESVSETRILNSRIIPE